MKEKERYVENNRVPDSRLEMIHYSPLLNRKPSFTEIMLEKLDNSPLTDKDILPLDFFLDK